MTMSTKKNETAAIKAVKSGQYDQLPEGVERRDLLNLFAEDKLTMDEFDGYVEWERENSYQKSVKGQGLRFKVGESGWITISGGNTGISAQRPVVLKGNSLLALLTLHREELLELVREALEGEFDIVSKKSKKGHYDVLFKGDVIVGSAGSAEQISRTKGLLEEMLSMAS